MKYPEEIYHDRLVKLQAHAAMLVDIINEHAERHAALYASNLGLHDEVEDLREKLAAAYVELSGTTSHASDCATSNAPAYEPGRCDCKDRCDD